MGGEGGGAAPAGRDQEGTKGLVQPEHATAARKAGGGQTGWRSTRPEAEGQSGRAGGSGGRRPGGGRWRRARAGPGGGTQEGPPGTTEEGRGAKRGGLPEQNGDRWVRTGCGRRGGRPGAG